MEKLDHRAFEELVEEEEQTCLVLFSRKSCHVCQAVHPILEGLEEEYADSDFAFYQVDVEEEPGLFQRMGGKGVPQVLYFAHGEIEARLAGEHEEDEYADQIEALL